MDSKKTEYIVKEKQWFTSSQTKQLLGVSDCELMHRRSAGKLTYKIKGNAFYYFIEPALGDKDGF